jgi:ABC-type Mn2+/Zn2+ transport system ATPase subunit
MAASGILAGLLPSGTDADTLEYLAGTAEELYEESPADVTVSALCEALSELLVSYELTPDEDGALGICKQLHEQMAAKAGTGGIDTASASASGAPPALLSRPLMMGLDEERVNTGALLGSIGETTDAFGNKVSAAAMANAGWKSESLATMEKASKEKDEEAEAGGVSIGMRLQTKEQLAEQAKRDAKEAEEARVARERACGLYLDSKAAGGSRDVSIRSMILLAPNGKALLEDGAPLRLSEGRKYGLVGRNGTGKTTLLNAISSYSITGFPAHLKVVHVEQDPHLDLSASALDTVLGFDLEERVLRQRVAELTAAVARASSEPPPSADLPPEEQAKQRKTNEKVEARLRKRLSETEHLLGEIASDTAEARAAAILGGLQFSPAMMRAPLRTLSGGWRMRATLAAALFVPCDILLLDEPTNHLDFPAVDWLTRWLQQCRSTALIVSHDRGFLDDVVTDVIQLKAKVSSAHAVRAPAPLACCHYPRILASHAAARTVAFRPPPAAAASLHEHSSFPPWQPACHRARTTALR